MAKLNMIGLARERYYHSIGSKIALIFGLTLLVYCILIIYQRFRTQTFDPILVMTFVTLVISIYILVDKNRSIMNTMGLYCLAMALTRIPSALIYILFPDPVYAFVIGIVFLVIAGNLLYSAWQYLHGICRGYITSTVVIFVLLLVYGALLVMSITDLMPDISGTTFERILSTEVLAANVCLFSVYLIVLGTDEIHDRCELEMSYDHVQTFRSMFDAGFDSSVSRKDARKITSDPSNWTKVDNGPVEYELRFIVSYTDKALYGTAQKWKGDGRLFFTISDTEWGNTMVEATRFCADEIAFDGNGIDDCTHLLFRKRNGDCFSIEVLDDNIEVIL